MKKQLFNILTIAFFATLTLFSNTTNAQYQLAKGGKQLNAGVGFSGWGLPLYVGLDFGVHKDISVGGELSFRSYRNNWGNNYYVHNIIGISANGNYHFNSLLKIPKEWDFYAGLNLGYYIWTTNNKNYAGSGGSGVGVGLQVGGRYYFSKNFGLNLELGGGNAFSGGKFGISYIF